MSYAQREYALRLAAKLETAPVEENPDRGLAELLRCAADETQLRAIWEKSKTFKNQWMNPTGKDSIGSLLFTCFHFKLSVLEARSVIYAWMMRHPDFMPDNFELWADFEIPKRYGQAEDQVTIQKSMESVKAAPLMGGVLDGLDRLLVVEKFEFDPVTKRVQVTGVVR